MFMVMVRFIVMVGVRVRCFVVTVRFRLRIMVRKL